ncbi:hypothetical protein ACHAXR_003082 [Thalassiosira sp. AJA248-18]
MMMSNLPPLLSVAMRAAMAFGNVAVRAFLMCASRTLTSVPNGTKMSRKSWPSTRRKRRTSTFALVIKCGRTLRPWSTLFTVLQEEKPRIRRGALQPSFRTNGNGHILRWCSM